MDIVLDFGDHSLTASLHDNPTAAALAEHLPCEVELTRWGHEAYGPLDAALPEKRLTDDVPPGGLAYTSRGDLLCIFYGQEPAWPVAHIGDIGEGWEVLRRRPPERVAIRTAG